MVEDGGGGGDDGNDVRCGSNNSRTHFHKTTGQQELKELHYHPIYYEVLLSSQGAGRFSLRRFRNDAANPGRVPVPLQVTHELLAKLVNDLTATIPANP